jgi:hypothetical protein
MNVALSSSLAPLPHEIWGSILSIVVDSAIVFGINRIFPYLLVSKEWCDWTIAAVTVWPSCDNNRLTDVMLKRFCVSRDSIW